MPTRNSARKAVVRLPGRSVADGLRLEDRGTVDADLAFEQHKQYRAQLNSFLGFSLIVLAAEERYPDSVFVEDPAIVVKNLIIRARLHNEKRQGEEDLLMRSLEPYFACRAAIMPPGTVEGGDVVVMDDHLVIGLSGRTNAEGAEQLARIVYDALGVTSSIVEIPRHWLHLKGGATYHRASTVAPQGLLTLSEEVADLFAHIPGSRLIARANERFAANCLSYGDRMIINAGCPHMLARLRKGFTVQETPMSEYQKIDGALSCLSKLL